MTNERQPEREREQQQQQHTQQQPKQQPKQQQQPTPSPHLSSQITLQPSSQSLIMTENPRQSMVWPSLDSYSTMTPEEILARYSSYNNPKPKPRKSVTPAPKKTPLEIPQTTLEPTPHQSSSSATAIPILPNCIDPSLDLFKIQPIPHTNTLQPDPNNLPQSDPISLQLDPTSQQDQNYHNLQDQTLHTIPDQNHYHLQDHHYTNFQDLNTLQDQNYNHHQDQNHINLQDQNHNTLLQVQNQYTLLDQNLYTLQDQNHITFQDQNHISLQDQNHNPLQDDYNSNYQDQNENHTLNPSVNPQTEQAQTSPNTLPQIPEHEPNQNPSSTQIISSTQITEKNTKKKQPSSSSQPTKRRRTIQTGVRSTNTPDMAQLTPVVPELSGSHQSIHPHQEIAINNHSATIPSNPTDLQPQPIAPIPKSRAKKTKANPNQGTEQQPPQENTLLQPDGPNPSQSTKKNQKNLADLESPSSQPKKRPRLSKTPLRTSNRNPTPRPKSPQPTPADNPDEGENPSGPLQSTQPSTSSLNPTGLESNPQQVGSNIAVPPPKKSKSVAASTKAQTKRNSVGSAKKNPLTQTDADKTNAQGEKSIPLRTTRSRKHSISNPSASNPDPNAAQEATPKEGPDPSQMEAEQATSTKKTRLRKSSRVVPPASIPAPEGANSVNPTDAAKTNAEGDNSLNTHTPRLRKSSRNLALAPTPVPVVAPDPNQTETPDAPTARAKRTRAPKKSLDKSQSTSTLATAEAAKVKSSVPNPQQQEEDLTAQTHEHEADFDHERNPTHESLFYNQYEGVYRLIAQERSIVLADDDSRRSVSTDQTSFLKKQKNQSKMKAKRLQKKQQESSLKLTPAFVPVLSSPAKDANSNNETRSLRPRPSNVPKHFGRWELSMPLNQDVPIAVLARMHQFLDEAVCAGFAKPIFRDPTPGNSNSGASRAPEGCNLPFKSAITTLPPIDHPTNGKEKPANRTTRKTSTVASQKQSDRTGPEEAELPSIRNRKKASRTFSDGSASLSDDINDTVMMALGLEESDHDDTQSTHHESHPPKKATEPSRFLRQKKAAAVEPTLDQPSPSNPHTRNLRSSDVHTAAKKPERKSLNGTGKTTQTKRKVSASKARSEESSSEDSSEQSDDDDDDEEDGGPTKVATLPARKTPQRKSSLRNVAAAKEGEVSQTKRASPKGKVRQVKPTASSSDSSSDDDDEEEGDGTTHPPPATPLPTARSARSKRESAKKGKEVPKTRATPRRATSLKPQSKTNVPIPGSDASSGGEDAEESGADDAPPSAQRTKTAGGERETSSEEETSSSGGEGRKLGAEKPTAVPEPTRERSPSEEEEEEEEAAAGAGEGGYRGRAPMTGRRKTLDAFRPVDFSLHSLNLALPPDPQQSRPADPSSDDDSSSSSSDDEDDDGDDRAKGPSQPPPTGLPAYKLAGAAADPSVKKKNKRLSVAQLWAKEESRIKSSKQTK